MVSIHQFKTVVNRLRLYLQCLNTSADILRLIRQLHSMNNDIGVPGQQKLLNQAQDAAWSFSRGYLHMGQVRLFLPHSSMQSLWKRCLHGVVLVRVFSTFIRQIMHSFSSSRKLGSSGYITAGIKSSKVLMSRTMTAGWQMNLGRLLKNILRQMVKEMQMRSMEERVDTTINSPMLSPLILQNSYTEQVMLRGLGPVELVSA